MVRGVMSTRIIVSNTFTQENGQGVTWTGIITPKTFSQENDEGDYIDR